MQFAKSNKPGCNRKEKLPVFSGAVVATAVIGLLNIFPLQVIGQMSARHAPTLWAAPPNPQQKGLPMRELFDHPEQWQRSRARIYGLAYADHAWAEFSDADLRLWFPQMKRWGLKMGMEVGAIKPWGPTGAVAFQKSRKNWDRLIANGAHFDTIALDEPLRSAICDFHQTPAYAVEQTAQYIALVRANYPDCQIGDIEPYPNTCNLPGFLDSLQARLRQMKVRGIDFFRVDVDYNAFQPGGIDNIAKWREVVDLEHKCRQRGIPFSLVYWAADYNLLKKKGLANDLTWRSSIVKQGEMYKAAGGNPDDFIIQSWIGVPEHSIPEGRPESFMNSVLVFAKRFVAKP